MKAYTPRRANVARWLEGAPAYVLDCFDSKNSGERYTVLFGGALAYHVKRDGSTDEGPDQAGNTYVQFLGMSGAPTHPQGVSMWGEFKPGEAATYRYRFGHQRVRWLDLPEHIREHVVHRATSED